jgi:uncharacterized delta-60 repeat protein
VVDEDLAIHSVAIQPADGKIVIGGISTSPMSLGGVQRMAILRYDADGNLDPGFSGDGIATTGSAGDQLGLADLALQPDGKIVAVTGSNLGGFTVLRYGTDGTLDPTFDGDGKTGSEVGVQLSEATSVATAPDGKIAVAGTATAGSSSGYSSDFAVARYLDAGVPAAATSLSITAPSKVKSGAKATITGGLSSAAPYCLKAQQVMLMRGTQPIGYKTTSATGTYKFTTKVTKKIVVQVVFPETPACSASESAKATIRVG